MENSWTREEEEEEGEGGECSSQNEEKDNVWAN